MRFSLLFLHSFEVLKQPTFKQRERARARVRARARARARNGQKKGKGERESTKALAILFLNRLVQSEKSTNYTVLFRKEQYSTYSEQSLGLVDYILSH
jgi:hypothetical protein